MTSNHKNRLQSFQKIIVLSFLMFGAAHIYAQNQKLHQLNFATAKQMQQFFAYKKNASVILSGHRGGLTKGFAENSIETFENTLKFYPAFFEVDPRLTKDSVVVLMHDATLNRTTNGTGKLADYTYEELQKLRLKDPEGNITEAKIPTLKQALLWSKGKTILNLDHKDVPPHLIIKLLNECKNDQVMLTVHQPDQANLYLKANSKWMLSAHVLNQKSLEAYEQANVDWNRIIAYIGPQFTPENKQLLKALNQKNVNCMISTAAKGDKLPEPERAILYQQIISEGANILETDRPIEVGKVLNL